MSGTRDDGGGCASCWLLLFAVLGMLVVHLSICYYVYKTSTFIAVVITFLLPVASELFWLGATLSDYGFTWVHLLFCLCCVSYFLAGVVPKLAEARADRRQRKAEKRQQEINAERAAREAAILASNDRYDAAVEHDAAAREAQKANLYTQIANLERILEVNRSSLPADGVADLERELADKKSEFYDMVTRR